MAAQTCPAALPLCVLGHRGCDEHERWVPVAPDWRKPRIRRRRRR